MDFQSVYRRRAACSLARWRMGRLMRANTQILQQPSLSLVAILLFRERHALVGPTDPSCVSRSKRAQTDKAIPSGLPASPVWLTAYAEISRGIGERALLIQNNDVATSWRNLEKGDRDFLCVSRSQNTHVTGSVGKLKRIAAKRLSD